MESNTEPHDMETHIESPRANSPLSLHEAAGLLAASSIHEAEVELARAIEHGELAANVKRWATEQWEGRQLPGNINRLETWIERAEFEAWAASKAAAGRSSREGRG